LMRARKTLLDEDERRSAAAAVFALLERMAAFMMADRVLMYHSLADELDTHAFLDKWHGRKLMYLPRVNGVDLDILPYERTRMHLGAFRIEEPDGDDVADVADMDMIVVPAVAYDGRGRRVGRGKGYYDRLLATARAVKVGVAYDFQLLDEDIETEAHDVGVDYVITPRRVVKTRRHK
ncbi:MAG: 5-formyltetrahydrofolate cyclo-ligase, partial [Muribaculaceae bacterium]|nr:5-formyltetrahydrofolate cyclo-ligase [Muribaculaceae bacterium]